MLLKVLNPQALLRRGVRFSPSHCVLNHTCIPSVHKFTTLSLLCQNKPTSNVHKNESIFDIQHGQRFKDSAAKSKIRDNESAKSVEETTKKSEKVLNVPNILTFSRLVAAPFVGYFIVKGESTIAMSLFTYSCVTDFVDGFIARKFNQMSVIGSIIDPMADKLLMTVCTVSLAASNTMPLYVAGIIVGRDVMLSFMGFYYRYISLPPPKTFKRFIDISIPTVSVHPNLLSKINTALQMVYIGSLVLQPGAELLLGDVQYVEYFQDYLKYFGILVSTTTLLSGGSYVFSNKAFKMLNKT